MHQCWEADLMTTLNLTISPPGKKHVNKTLYVFARLPFLRPLTTVALWYPIIDEIQTENLHQRLVELGAAPPANNLTNLCYCTFLIFPGEDVLVAEIEAGRCICTKRDVSDSFIGFLLVFVFAFSSSCTGWKTTWGAAIECWSRCQVVGASY